MEKKIGRLMAGHIEMLWELARIEMLRKGIN